MKCKTFLVKDWVTLKETKHGAVHLVGIWRPIIEKPSDEVFPVSLKNNWIVIRLIAFVFLVIPLIHWLVPHR